MPVTHTGGTPADIRAAVALALSPERRRFVVTAAAREAQARAEAAYQQEFGRVPETAVTVDGRAATGLTGLDPDQGEVAFRFARASEALAWIHAQLVAQSPKLTGAYAAAHILLADDQPADPANPPPAARYIFLNTRPYARKVERWDGVYQAVAVLADRRFGNSVHVGFGYESPTLDYIAGETGRSARARLRGQPTRVAGMRLERATRVPAITVVLA
ncbi:hypothetical protein Q8W71_17670 [Methylobacterium sp. NEAU 140]|uniref:hypothetical protein n=1 Tax=Methylobacterium sp. NEAU 140 TaxID=3064945 RepID=UPI00273493F6|nr:hypothetical protein [Methylobacterium sp. NEAU 140]MDP4024457.1 hypothetical protein [Methylobacterium sp. NEAU 140]